jgi:integrase
MKQRYRLYRRGHNGRYYVQDNITGKQESLGTSNRAEALRLYSARNEASYQPAFSIHLARTYLVAGDPAIGTRTWQTVMDTMLSSKVHHAPRTIERYESAFKEMPFESLRKLAIIETRPENLLRVLQCGTVSTNIFLHRMHSFALSMGWLPWPILSYKQWPPRRFKTRRAITAGEAARLVDAEKNPEWRAFLELLWHVGAAQVDLAALTAEDVDWANQTLSYHRRKNGNRATVKFGPRMAEILKRLPQHGLLFPHHSRLSSADRASRFTERCRKLGITGVSLHSYRYAWAERARVAGYPERFAMEALGHSSAAVHRGYAKGARVEVPSLESFEQGESSAPQLKIIQMPGAAGQAA